MSDMWSNEYGDAAGPGAKRREAKANKREYLDDRPKPKTKGKVEPYHRPRQKDAEERIWNGRAIDVQRKIIKLTLQISSVGEIVERLEQEAYGPASKVLVSGIRNHTMAVLKVIMDEGLITEKQLARYRRDAHDAQKRRFKRRDD